MRRRKARLVYASVSTAVLAAAAFSGRIFSDAPAEAHAVPVDTKTVERGGEVDLSPSDSVRPSWMPDGAIASMLRSTSDPIVAAARLQLQSWTSDTTMNLALTILRDHAAMQQGLDSLTGAMHIAPIRPAIADSMQAPYDLSLQRLYGLWAHELEMGFLREQHAVHVRLLADLSAMAGAAREPGLASFISTRAIVTERAHLARIDDAARGMARADSTRGDGRRE